jgi:LuxR family maltose regulon positive regulatory protein
MTAIRSRAPASPERWPDLIGSKLVVPSPPRGAILRTRLLRRLRASRDRRIVSIVAPPGYGKTSVLVQWATSDRRSVAWLTADDGDNDPAMLLAYLAAALGGMASADRELLDAIESPVASTRALVGRLLATVSDRAAATLVVIDDAHRIVERTCLDALAELITHLPGGSQVVLASREPVDLPLARWRAQGWLDEVGPAELAMDQHEATTLVRQLRSDVPAGAAERLFERTEGWPALVALAALASRTSPAGGDVSDPAGTDLAIADYLRSQLLESRPEEEVAFLTRTSILERLHGPLCDAVVGTRRSSSVLARLARSTILVDDYGGTYRYHSLLREFLSDELETREPESIAELHRRAAVWLRSAGDLNAAIGHAFAAGDLDEAAALVGGVMLGNHWSGRRGMTRTYLDRFSDDALLLRPWLAVLAAWEHMRPGDGPTPDRYADIAERATFSGRPPDGTASFGSGRAMLRAAMCRKGIDDALANAEVALALEPGDSAWRDYALWMRAIVRLGQGDVDRAEVDLAHAVAVARANENTGLCYCLLGHRALLAIDRSDWASAIPLMEEARGLGAAARVDGYLSSVAARIAEIRIAIHQGRIAEARRELGRAAGLRSVLAAHAPVAAVLFLLGLARAHLAVGDGEGARTLLRQATGVLRLRPDLGVLPSQVAALRAEMTTVPIGRAGASTLTAAELRVLALLPYYLSFKEIAQRLGVKVTTVRTHAVSIYDKLGASSRSEAVEIAVTVGLLDRFLHGGPSAPGESGEMPSAMAPPDGPDLQQQRSVLDRYLEVG